MNIQAEANPPTIYFNLFLLQRKKYGNKSNNFKENIYALRLLIKSRDGKKIPVSILYKKRINLESAPLLIYGYGSYGLIAEPSFKLSFLPLVDDGFISAIAHVRGGQTCKEIV